MVHNEHFGRIMSAPTIALFFIKHLARTIWFAPPQTISRHLAVRPYGQKTSWKTPRGLFFSSKKEEGENTRMRKARFFELIFF